MRTVLFDVVATSEAADVFGSIPESILVVDRPRVKYSPYHYSVTDYRPMMRSLVPSCCAIVDGERAYSTISLLIFHYCSTLCMRYLVTFFIFYSEDANKYRYDFL